MKKSRVIIFYLILCVAGTLLLGGCAFIKKFFGEDEEKAASELMADGTSAFERGQFEKAKEAFQKVKDRYPYSKYAVTAELRMADSMYEGRDYDEAYEAYDEFERLHPKNQEIPYAIYQKGMCQFRQVKTIDREQGHTLKAKEEFERLIGRFPRDEYAQKARKNLRKCMIFLADYELYVANYYYKMGKYRAALARYTYLIEHFQDMGQYNQALELIARCKEQVAKEEKEAWAKAQKEAEKAQKEAEKTAAKEAQKK
ncbi:MAG: outer membrane protein assembly factor BamD [Thermodesulfobacteriota bacterium]